MWHQAEQFQVISSASPCFSSLASSRENPENIPRSKITVARQSTGKAEQSHSGRRPTHVQARTDERTDTRDDIQTLRLFRCPHLYAGVSAQEVPRQLWKPSKKKERQKPNANQSKHLVALHVNGVHPLRSSSKVASVCIMHSSFASSLICTLAVQEHKVLRLLFFFSSCQTCSKPSKPQHPKILLARDGTDELFNASAWSV